VDQLVPIIEQARAASADRKTYALEHCQKQPALFQKIMYQFWEHEPSQENVTAAVVQLIERNTGTGARLESVRGLFNARYQDQGAE